MKMYNKTNRDIGSSISLYADIETHYQNKLIRFKHVRIYIYSYIPINSAEVKSDDESLPFYRFIARAKFEFDERNFTISTELTKSQVGDALKYGDHHFLIGYTWQLWENFSKKSAIANLPSSILNQSLSVIELNPDGTVYEPEAEHPNNKIIYGTKYKHDGFYYVVTMKENPDVGFMYETDAPYYEEGSIYYHDKDYMGSPSIVIPEDTYNIDGPMLRKKALKLSKNLKKIAQPSDKSLYEITRFIELILDTQSKTSKEMSTEDRLLLEKKLKIQARLDTEKYLANKSGKRIYIKELEGN